MKDGMTELMLHLLLRQELGNPFTDEAPCEYRINTGPPLRIPAQKIGNQPFQGRRVLYWDWRRYFSTCDLAD